MAPDVLGTRFWDSDGDKDGGWKGICAKGTVRENTSDLKKYAAFGEMNKKYC